MVSTGCNSQENTGLLASMTYMKYCWNGVLKLQNQTQTNREKYLHCMYRRTSLSLKMTLLQLAIVFEDFESSTYHPCTTGRYANQRWWPQIWDQCCRWPTGARTRYHWGLLWPLSCSPQLCACQICNSMPETQYKKIMYVFSTWTLMSIFRVYFTLLFLPKHTAVLTSNVVWES